MKRRYEKKLEPYMNDNPDKWAEDLYKALNNNKHLMSKWVNDPTQGGVSIAILILCLKCSLMNPRTFLEE